MVKHKQHSYEKKRCGFMIYFVIENFASCFISLLTHPFVLFLYTTRAVLYAIDNIVYHDTFLYCDYNLYRDIIVTYFFTNFIGICLRQCSKNYFLK